MQICISDTIVLITQLDLRNAKGAINSVVWTCFKMSKTNYNCYLRPLQGISLAVSRQATFFQHKNLISHLKKRHHDLYDLGYL